MSASNVDRLLTAWMESDAPAREPEHLLGDVLARTARTRRRPAWLIPERWISMQTTLRWQSLPRLAPLLALLALILLAMLAVALVGNRQRLPAPYGPAANGLIAYMSGPQIVVADADGSGPRPISPGAAIAGEPVFSPLGNRIAFKVYTTSDSTDQASLIVADVDGGHAVTIERDATFLSTPSWSPDSRSVTYSKGGGGDFSERVFVAPVDGSSAPQQVGDPTRWAVNPAFSPDGRRIAFVSEIDQQRLFVMNADGSTARDLSGDQLGSIGGGMEHGGTGFAWSHDGTSLLVSAGKTDDERDLYVIAVDGPIAVRQVTRTPLLEYGASWSPHGDRIAYFRGQPGDFPTVLVSDTDGAALKDIGQGVDFAWFSPTWSPDGSIVVATSRGPGSMIYLLDPEGVATPRTITIEDYQIPSENENAPGGTDIVGWQRIAP